jgi:uncharacterized protein YjlB
MTTETYTTMTKGLIPNSRFPLLVHRQAIAGGGVDAVKQRFQHNGWSNNWEYPGIYTYSHYHSTTHECLGCANGWMEVEVSGKGGIPIRVESGDVIVMPAGVPHAMTGCSDDVMMVGGYPDGRDWDNIQEEFSTQEDFRAAAKRIMMLPIPSADPVSGKPLQQWLDAPSSVDGGWNDYRDGLDRSG